MECSKKKIKKMLEIQNMLKTIILGDFEPLRKVFP